MTETPTPATIEVARNQLANVAEEMQHRVMNAAYSSNWQEAGDLSSALVSPGAEIVGQARRIVPMHVATMTNTIAAAIEGTGGYDALEPGDVVIQNDPYAGNNHLPDVLVFQPAFKRDTLLGFSSVRAHWLDIGGQASAGYAADAGDLIAEGLRIPPVKLYEGGDKNETVVDFLLSNVRDADKRKLDLDAQLAGVAHGHDRLLDLAAHHGAETLCGAMDQVLANDEQRIRNEIAALPDGVYTARDVLDDDGVGTTEIHITAALEVDGDEITVDFASSHDQVEGAVNATYSVTEAAAHYAIKCVLAPTGPGTLGAYRPISVTAPEGSVVNPTFPAPVVYGSHETGNRVHDVVVQALAEVAPERVYAGGEGSGNGLVYKSTASGAVNLTRLFGGMGGCPARDGINAKRSGVGNVGIEPMEHFEERFDFVQIETFEIARDTGGAGRHRGGNASRMVVTFEDETRLTFINDRMNSRPYAVAGGEQGQAGELRITTPEGDEIKPEPKGTRTVPAGSTLTIQPAGGGGYGDPTTRDPSLVIEDVRDEYVSPKTAEATYEVVIDTETMTVNEPETSRRRDSVNRAEEPDI